MSKREKILRIRCTPKTLKKFKRFAIDFEVYEDALNHLLDQGIKISDDELIEWMERKLEDKSYSSRSHLVEFALMELKSREPKPF